MSETRGKKNSTMVALAVVLAVAVIVSLVLFNQRNSLSAQVDNLSEELAESREAWEATAAEKEVIEAELKDAQDALREAETALEESTVKIASLQDELVEAQRVRTEAKTTLEALSGQIESLTETLDYARSVLAGATEDPEEPVVIEPLPEETDEAEDTEAPSEEPTEEPTEEPEAEETEEPTEEPSEEPTEEPEAEATEEPADEPEAEAEVTEEPAEEPEDEETEAPAEAEATQTDIVDVEIPEDAVELEISVLRTVDGEEVEALYTLYVVVEDNTITFIYAEKIDEAFLAQFVGKTLPVALLSDEEPEGIAPIEDDEEMTLAVIEAVNGLLPAEEEAVMDESSEEPAA